MYGCPLTPENKLRREGQHSHSQDPRMLASLEGKMSPALFWWLFTDGLLMFCRRRSRFKSMNGHFSYEDKSALLEAVSGFL